MMMRRRYREFLNLELWADWFSALIEKWRWTAASLPPPPPLFFSRKKKMSLSLSLSLCETGPLWQVFFNYCSLPTPLTTLETN